ncbi:MAG: hypothetical protein WBF06_11380 [Candidatus Acidiferrales bacterium]
MIRVTRETHETPPWAARVLRAAGGINRFGEPNYRAVWGWNRLAWVGGRFEDRDAAGTLIRECVELRREPKYPAVDRWHIERWAPPEFYGSPRDWQRNTIEIEGARAIPALGPYPSRGEYEHCLTLESPRGDFIPLTPAALAHVARAIEWSRGLRAGERRAALDRRDAREDRDYDSFADALLSDTGRAFHGAPFVSVSC